MNKQIDISALSDSELEAFQKQLVQARQNKIAHRRDIIEGLKTSLDKLSMEGDAEKIAEVLMATVTRLKEAKPSFRGRRVTDETRTKLEHALKNNTDTLNGLADKYGVSVSYLWHMKRDLGLTVPKKGAEPAKVA